MIVFKTIVVLVLVTTGQTVGAQDEDTASEVPGVWTMSGKRMLGWNDGLKQLMEHDEKMTKDTETDGTPDREAKCEGGFGEFQTCKQQDGSAGVCCDDGFVCTTSVTGRQFVCIRKDGQECNNDSECIQERVCIPSTTGKPKTCCHGFRNYHTCKLSNGTHGTCCDTGFVCDTSTTGREFVCIRKDGQECNNDSECIKGRVCVNRRNQSKTCEKYIAPLRGICTPGNFECAGTAWCEARDRNYDKTDVCRVCIPEDNYCDRNAPEANISCCAGTSCVDRSGRDFCIENPRPAQPYIPCNPGKFQCPENKVCLTFGSKSTGYKSSCKQCGRKDDPCNPTIPEVSKTCCAPYECQQRSLRLRPRCGNA